MITDKLKIESFKIYWTLVFVVFASFIIAALSGCGDKIKRQKANVLLITIDTLRADHLGAYGYSYIRTPTIDKIASEGVLFECAMTAIPLTLPSHTTIMTGLYPLAHGVRDNNNFKVPDEVTTLAEIFKKQGYNTGSVVGAFVLDRMFGLNQGFDSYDDSGMGYDGEKKAILVPDRKADVVADHAIAWLNEIKNSDKPFFLWTHFYDPHANYNPPAPFSQEYSASPYDGEIAFADQQLGRLLDSARKASGKLPLLIVLVADHGESLGEHQEKTHGILLYNSTIHVPLIIACKGILPTGKRIKAQVRSVDIAPTILDLLGLQSGQTMQGKSLVELIEKGKEREDRPAYMEAELPFLQYGWSDLKALSAHGYIYILSPKPELYDIIKDFNEEHDLVSEESQTADNMNKLLSAMIRQISNQKFQTTAQNPTMSVDAQKQLMALGYIHFSAKPTATSEIEMKNLPNPRDMIPLHNKFMKAVSLMWDEKYSEASEIFKILVEKDPNNMDFEIYYIKSLCSLNQIDYAKRLLKAILEKNPDSAEAIELMASIEYEAGDIEVAKTLYEESLRLSPQNASANLQLAVIALKQGQNAKAKELLNRALELSPSNAIALDMLVRILRDEGDMNKAKMLVDNALFKFPRDTVILYKAAGFYANIHDRNNALKLFIRIAELDPKSANAQCNIGLELLIGADGELFSEGADPIGALKYFNEALKLDPNMQVAREKIEFINSKINSGVYNAAPR